MSKTFRTLLSLLLVLGIAVVLAFAGYQLYLRYAPVKHRDPDWVTPEVTAKADEQNGRLRVFHAAREALAANREEGIAKLRQILEQMPGTGEASEARIILAQTLAEDPAAKPEALQFLGEVIAEPNPGRRRLRALLLRSQMLLDSDPEAATRDLTVLIDPRYSFSDPSLHAAARITLAKLAVKQGDPTRAMEILTPILATGLAEKAEAVAGIREAIAAHSKTLADAQQWDALLTWSEGAIKNFPDVPGFRNVLRFRQAVAHRHLGRLAVARTFLNRLRRDVPAELLDPDIHLDAEFAALTQAEEALGICRTPEAFLRAKQDGKEKRAHFQGDLAADATWTVEQSPLVLTGLVTVKPGVTLTIAPGARVEFLQGARLAVEGALVAAGTAEKPIVLSSAVTQPDARSCFDGEGVEFAKSSDAAKSRLEHCTLEHQRVALAVRGVPLAVRHCTFRANGQTALLATDGAAVAVEECTFAANDGTGIHAVKSSPVIRRCTVKDSGRTGILFEGDCTPTVAACRITGSGRAGIECDNGANATIQGNRIEANTGGGIRCNRTSNATIQGNLIAKNGDFVPKRIEGAPDGEALRTGDGIRCERDSNCQVIGNAIQDSAAVGIAAVNCEPTLQGNRITGNRYQGIVCTGAAPRIEGNLLRGNATAGIACLENSQPVIHNNFFGFHKPSYIGNAGSLDIDARDNYFEKDGKAPDDDEFIKYLYDHKDQSTLGYIRWQPRLAAPPPEPPMPELKDIP